MKDRLGKSVRAEFLVERVVKPFGAGEREEERRTKRSGDLSRPRNKGLRLTLYICPRAKEEGHVVANGAHVS